MANPAKAYLTVQVETTSQGQLLIMLYDACIKFMKQAKVEIEKRDYAKKGTLINRALAIIHELAESLNKEKGGEISANLAGIYHFCTNELVQANIKLDTEKIDNVIKIIDGIRSAYAQIIPESEGKATMGTPASQNSAPAPNAAAAQGAAVAQNAAARTAAPKPTPATPEQKAETEKAKTPQQQPGSGYPAANRSAPAQGQPLKPVAPRPQINAAKSRANNAYFNAGR